MDFLKKQALQIKAQLGDLSLSTKFLIGAVLVILVMVAGILIVTAYGTDRVPVSNFAEGRSAEVLNQLRSAGIDAEQEGAVVTVPADQREDALAALAANNLLAANAADAFNQLVSEQSMFTNDKQNTQRMLIAKQTFLSRVIRKMNNVEDAHVVVDYPDRKGFGNTHSDPSASVVVRMQAGRSVSKNLVAAVAGLVSGAVAELKPQDVQVVDGNTNQAHTVGDPLDAAPGEAQDAIRLKEAYHREKLQNHFGRIINGIIITVRVRTDNIKQRASTRVVLDSDQDELSNRSETRKDTDFENGGEPGVRSNVGATIDGGGGIARSMEEEITDSTLAPRPITEREHITSFGLNIRQINVSVSIPRSHFVNVFHRQQPEVEAPTDAELQPVIDSELAKIENLIKPQVVAEVEPQIAVAMHYDPVVELEVAGSGIGAVLSDAGISTGVVTAGVLGIAALGLMFYLTRKATQRETLPSVEELAGLPPTLPADDELLGEVEEVDTGMEGVELDESELRARKMADQISELIKANPEEAGTLLNKWVDLEE
ncbi:MAG: hypothetical protein AAF750_07325 [Planctomycetota bacterium]